MRNDGTKCALGCLIPDDLYSSEFEGAGFHQFFDTEQLYYSDCPGYVKRRSLMLRQLWGDESQSLLMALQSVHDESDVRDWRDRLIATAVAHHLTLPKCLQKENP